jgi:hypothetical protein
MLASMISCGVSEELVSTVCLTCIKVDDVYLGFVPCVSDVMHGIYLDRMNTWPVTKRTHPRRI